MTTTPLMGLALPVDHGSADIWDVILDAVFGVIDSHDHTTGKGAQVPSAALKINADVSWSASAVSRAITDLKAIDFAPQAASGMTALAGALFLNSADNELYWRNTSGALVKFTAGAALNVAAFTGGIGGDYSAAGALVVFDDSTDSYWFQQQIGTGVRQYARMRSADVDLYEFKANPAAGVPTNRVRLASPAALAGSYTLTMPATLQATTATLQVSSTGVMTAALPAVRLFSGAEGAPLLGASFVGNGHLDLQNSTAEQYFPLRVNAGETISAWSMFITKTSNATHTLTTRLIRMNLSTGIPVLVGVAQTTSAAGPGAAVTLSQSGLSELAAAGFAYALGITGDGVVSGDVVNGYSLTVL